MSKNLEIVGEGRYLKKCKCGQPYRSDARHQKYSPVCKCAEKAAKQRAKRAKERREYRKDPETHKALSRTRAAARKMVLAHHGITVKSAGGIIIDFDNPNFAHIGCNSPGCDKNFATFLAQDHEKNGGPTRGARQRAMRETIKRLEAHHRDHNPFNNTLESYPERSNIELLCRTHHEQADRAKPKTDQDGNIRKHAEMVIWRPQPRITVFEFLLDVRTRRPKLYFNTPTIELVRLWEKNYA